MSELPLQGNATTFSLNLKPQLTPGHVEVFNANNLTGTEKCYYFGKNN